MKKSLSVCTGYLSLFLFFSFIVFLVFALLQATNELFAIGSDYIAFLTGAKMVSKGLGSRLYELDTQFMVQQELISSYVKTDFLLPFRNLPFFAYFLIPLTKFSLVDGYRIFEAMVIFSVFVFSLLTYKLLPESRTNYFVPLASLFYYPFINSIQVSQYSPLIALFFLIIYWFLRSRKVLLSGVISGIFLLKPQYLLIFPFLFLKLKKPKEFLTGFFFTTALLTFVSFKAVGIRALFSYPFFLAATETPGFGSRPWHMFSFYSFFNRLIPASERLSTLFMVINIILYLIVYLVYKKRVKSLSFDKAFALSGILAIPFAGHVLVHDLSIVMVSILILLMLFEEEKSKRFKKTYFVSLATLYLLPYLIFAGASFLSPFIYLIVGFFLMGVFEKNNLLKMVPSFSRGEKIIR